ncbi:MAG TPA: hypothetical protein EYN66_07380 [Myxococcales bacterium]|nr:hypothetical protein [Myxococcales bacterium]
MHSPKLMVVLRVGAAKKALKQPWTKERILDMVHKLGLDGASDPDFLLLMRSVTGKTDIGDLDSRELEELGESLISSVKKHGGCGCG